jgi:hypothetical protein
MGGLGSGFAAFRGRTGFEYQLQLLKGDSSSRTAMWVDGIYFNSTPDNYSARGLIRDPGGAGALINLSMLNTIVWSDDANNPESTRDVGLARHTNGVLRVTNGGGGSGDLVLRKLFDSNGMQVVTTQQAFIANPTGGAIIDAEARAAITSINSLLRTHGLQAAS